MEGEVSGLFCRGLVGQAKFIGGWTSLDKVE